MFAGKTLLARHRAVYAALGSMMKTDIHALSIQALVDEGEGQSTIVVGAVQNV